VLPARCGDRLWRSEHRSRWSGPARRLCADRRHRRHPDGHGYWVATAAGAVFGFGDAPSEGSLPGDHLNAPIVGIAATPDGHGYWLAAADGGVFTFGTATFYGSLGNLHLNAPIVGIAATPDGHGYRLAAADGGVFTFGTAPSTDHSATSTSTHPSSASPPPRRTRLPARRRRRRRLHLRHRHLLRITRQPPPQRTHRRIAATPDGHGYRLAAADGGVFTFGTATFYGSDGGAAHVAPAVGLADRPGGYWIAYGENTGADMISAISNYVSTGTTTSPSPSRTCSPAGFTVPPGVVEHTASTLKVDILATLLSEAQARGGA